MQLGAGVELATMVVPNFFLPLACAANVAKVYLTWFLLLASEIPSASGARFGSCESHRRLLSVVKTLPHFFFELSFLQEARVATNECQNYLFNLDPEKMVVEL